MYRVSEFEKLIVNKCRHEILEIVYRIPSPFVLRAKGIVYTNSKRIHVSWSSDGSAYVGGVLTPEFDLIEGTSVHHVTHPDFKREIRERQTKTKEDE